MQKLIAWLEDTHIRRLPIRDRAPLIHAPFTPALHDYLVQLNAPAIVLPPNVKDEVSDVRLLHPALAWLVDLALNLHYSDDADYYNEPVDPWDGLCVPVVKGANSSPEVKEATANLLKILNIEDPPESPEDGLNIAADIIEHLTADTPTTVGEVPSLDDIPLGFSTNDPLVDRVVKIMRVLHIRQLHDLQDDINDIIADMQAITADPKTNSKLGKIGR